MTKIFVNQPEQLLSIVRQCPVETLDDEQPLCAECRNLSICRWQSVFFKLQAQPLVINRRGEVCLFPANQPDGEFEDVRRRCCTSRLHPFSIPPQERVFLLHASKRNSEIVIGVLHGTVLAWINYVQYVSLDILVINHDAVSLSLSTGEMPSGSSCKAPTQSQPTAARRSNALIEPVLNRAATRLRMMSLSGSSPSK